MAIGDGNIGGKKPARESGSGNAVLTQIRAELKNIYQLMRKHEQRNQQGAAGQLGSGSGTGSGGEQKKEGGGEGPSVRQQVAGALGGAAAAGIGAILKPMQTSTERAYAGIQAAASELAGQGAILAAQKAGLDTAAQMRAGEAGASVASGALDQAFHRDRQVTQEMRGGFADLRELAALGINIDDDMLARRTDALRQRADRGYDFDVKMNDFIGESVNPLNKLPEEVRQLIDSLGGFVGTMSSMNSETRDLFRNLRESNRATEDQNYRMDSAQ